MLQNSINFCLLSKPTGKNKKLLKNWKRSFRTSCVLHCCKKPSRESWFHIEEENASGPMAQVIGRMEAIAADTGCSIVFLHHASKGAAMMGAGDQQQASRGSSVLVDNIRWQSYLSSMTSAEAEEWGVDDDQRRFFVRFGVSKANYGAPFADRWFRRHDGGVLKPAVLERQRKSKGVPRGEA